MPTTLDAEHTLEERTPFAMYFVEDCAEPAGPRKTSARALRASGHSRSSGRLVSFCAPGSLSTNSPADVALRNHCVLSCTNEEAVADDEHLPTRLAAPSHQLQAAARDDCIHSWPPHREARGFMSLRLDPASASSVEALVSVHHNVLNIHIQSSPGVFDKKLASIPVGHLVVTLRPGQFELLVLSCLTEDSEEIFCCCKDQIARNKWVYVFRRVAGVKVRPLPRLALRPLASSSAGPSQISTSVMRSQHTSAAMAGPSHSERVRAKFLEMQARRGHISAATRHATEVTNARNDSDSQNTLVLGTREVSILSQVSTCAGSGHATPVAKSERGYLQSMSTSKVVSQRTVPT
mmetsp:Transcript_38264/g.61671  ORF Transcript_38264/g.61671 Transcript_38264/m.61671 type:complete len:349 (+) Transcript_38264:51-1097(+)